MDIQGFYRGQVLNAYEFLGAHIQENGVIFRTFAPSAKCVSVLINDEEVKMNRIYDGNFYEVFIGSDKAKEGNCYEFRIYKQDNTYTDHCDPYGFGMQFRPEHKSVIRNLQCYPFSDAMWMNERCNHMNQPLNIYEMHLGSWRRKKDGTWYTYREIAQQLADYVKENGYNYVEFLPLSEHPCDESWGYQNTGFFAPTSRYGTAEDVKYMIDVLHQNKIGAILDFVPVHFAIDDYGLARYDGTYLYEYPSNDVGVSEWGSCNFMHSRPEVRSFLQSAANYWLKEYHFDGLRMDAISRIIYWQGDEKRGVNGNAVDFIKVMNKGLKQENPGCILIAEDSTNYPNVTKEVDQGGLGFDYKWDMGWMHDTLEYFQSGPEYRSDLYHKLTFSMMYYWNETYLLALSHDEVVHGKATIIQKMNGDYERKFPQVKAMYLYMMVHPGKKLNFMGNEIGQFREWDEKREQDWNLLDYPKHRAFSCFMKELNHIYLSQPALYEQDYKQSGFEWEDCHQEQKCIYVIRRTASNSNLISILNFSDKVQEYDLKISKKDTQKLVGQQKKDEMVEHTNERLNIEETKNPYEGFDVIFHTDWEHFDGKTKKIQENCILHKDGLKCTIPAFSGLIIKTK